MLQIGALAAFVIGGGGFTSALGADLPTSVAAPPGMTAPAVPTAAPPAAPTAGPSAATPPPETAATPISPTAATGNAKPEDLFRQYSPLVFQIKSAVNADAPKSSYGSGFVIAKDGLVATNYHVVSDAVHEADKYKIFLVTTPQPLEAKIVAIDVIHDLAIIKVPMDFPGVLEVSPDTLPVGEKMYSLGMPHDLNMSIVDGLCNGLIKHGVYEQIQMSAPINPGMSGGPVLGADGKVHGVNVAVMHFSQNLTFAVPSGHLKTLIESLPAASLEGKDVKGIKAVIEEQLNKAQQALRDDWESTTAKSGDEKDKIIELGAWKIPKPSPTLKCWLTKSDDNKPKDERRIEVTTQTCDLQHSAFVSQRVQTGTYKLHYWDYENLKLNALQFFGAINTFYNKSALTHVMNNIMPRSLLGDEWRDHTTRECSQQSMQNAHGVPMRVNFCVGTYFDYRSLYDASMKLVTLVPNRSDQLIISTEMWGFTLPNIIEFIQKNINSVKLETQP